MTKRPARIMLSLTATYWVFISGTAYFYFFLPLRVFHYLVATLLLGLWAVSHLRGGRGLPATALDLPLLGFGIVALLAAAFGQNPRVSLEYLWLPGVHVLLFYVFVGWVQRGGGNTLLDILSILGVVVAFISLAELVSWFWGLGWFPNTTYGWAGVLGPGLWLPPTGYRPAVALNFSTLNGAFIGPLAVLAFARSLATRQSVNRWLLRVMALVFFLVLLATQSRGGVLGVVGAVLFLLVVRNIGVPHTALRPRVLALGGGAIALALLGVFLVSVERASGDSARRDMWRSAAEITRDNPVLGVGPVQFGRAYRDYWTQQDARKRHGSAHNVYLNVAAETGLAGATLAMAGAVALAVAYRRNRRVLGDRPTGRANLDAAMAAFVALSVHSLVDVLDGQPFLLMFSVLGAYIVASRDDEPTYRPQVTVALPLVALLVWCGGLSWVARAESQYRESIVAQAAFDLERAAQYAQRAERTDPWLHLYDLQIANIAGLRAAIAQESNIADRQVLLAGAMRAYDHALALEPNWDEGWLNRAALAAYTGEYEQALAFAQQAHDIWESPLTSLHLARFTEAANAAPMDEQVRQYVNALYRLPTLPTANFWTETSVRREAVETWLAEDNTYRSIAYLRWQGAPPLDLAERAPSDPTHVAQWLAVALATGEADAYAIVARVANNTLRAQGYLGLGWLALAADDEATARRYAIIASLTWSERAFGSPAYLLTVLDDDVEMAQMIAEAQGVPPLAYTQEFASVMYNQRPAALVLLPPIGYYDVLLPGFSAYGPPN